MRGQMATELSENKFPLCVHLRKAVFRSWELELAPAPRQLRSSSAPRELDLKKIEERAESLQLRSSGAFHEKKSLLPHTHGLVSSG